MLVTAELNPTPLQVDMINHLENDPTFEGKLAELGNEITPLLFTTNYDGKIRLFSQLNSLSFSAYECFYVNCVRTILKDNGFNIYSTEAEQVQAYYKALLIQRVQRGVNHLSKLESDILASRYTHKMTYKAISELYGLTIYKVKQQLERFTPEAYRAFLRCSQGREPYQIVMGHCTGFICDQPQFDPWEIIETEEQAKILEAGDLVSDWGSLRASEVSSLSSGGRCVFCEGSIKVLPVRRLAKRYKNYFNINIV